MAELHWTEIDGVTTVWTETHRPLTAGLVFRAGRADETLATAGHTHLIEHLALSSLDGAPEREGGEVGGVHTLFGTTNSTEEVSAFLQRVSRALRSLRGQRLESEKQVLAAEAASRPYDVCGNLLIWRYGAAGYGLTGMPEYGLRGATLPKLHALAAERFTSENAILWLAGPPPAGLHFELHHGVKHPVPRLPPILPAFPSWFVDDRCRGVAASAIVPRVSAATFFHLIAGRRLHERLRIKRAVSYAPSVSYQPLDAEIAHVVFFADSDSERRGELVDAFAEVFESLGDFGDAEIQIVRKELLDGWVGPLAPPPEDHALQDVQRAAHEWILGRDFESIESIADEARSVTAADVSAFGCSVQRGALFALPGEVEPRPMMGDSAPPSTVQVVEGRPISNCDAPVNNVRLVHGTEGVTLRHPSGAQLTVRYAELAAALTYEDGCVVLIGSDAATIAVEPTLWPDGPRICREIRERVPGHLLLDQGVRAAGAIPKPDTTRWQRLRARLAPRAGATAG